MSRMAHPPEPPGLDRLLAAAPHLPAPWLAHAQAYRGEAVGLALVLAEYGRYLHDLARAGATAELAACLAAVDDVLAGGDAALAALVEEHVLGTVIHMPLFSPAWPLGPTVRARLGLAG
jgi:hypothetical protein